MSWYVYILKCADGTFYTGITTCVERRCKEHNGSVKGAKYTRARRPVSLHFFETQPSRTAAAQREYVIRRLSAAEKSGLSQIGQRARQQHL